MKREEVSPNGSPGRGSLDPETQAYFHFLAETGITKHTGALDSTLALIEQCQIQAGQSVLDVGCGPGLTACLLTRQRGCTVVGVDLVPQMLEHARRRARREGVEDRVQFEVADVLDLPYEADRFDVVIAESVLVFVSDPARALREMARVARPGGIVGLNEMTLLQSPVPPEVQDAMAHTTGISGEPRTEQAWAALLREAGLQEVVARAYSVDLHNEAKSRLKRWGWAEMFRAMGRTVRVMLRSPSSRTWLKGTLGRTQPLTRYVLDYAGYGVYTGVKSVRPSVGSET